jgi:hypothetical protein
MPSAGVHDAVWCSAVALVLVTGVHQKRQRPYRVLNVRLADCFGIDILGGPPIENGRRRLPVGRDKRSVASPMGPTSKSGEPVEPAF